MTRGQQRWSTRSRRPGARRRGATLGILAVGFALLAATATAIARTSTSANPCGEGQALEKLGRLNAAEAAYLRELGGSTSVACATDGPPRLGQRADSCAFAKALNDAGERQKSHAAYLEVLAADPGSTCAVSGARQTAAPASVWSWLSNAAANAGYALAAAVLSVLLITIVVLLWLQLQTRVWWLRDRWPARVIRRPTLEVAKVDDSALPDRLGPSIAGLIRGRVTWKRDPYGVNLVSGQAGIARPLTELGDISGETKAAVALISFLTASLPRRNFVLEGELQPAGMEGAGISLELSRQAGFEALISFWARPLGLVSPEGPETLGSPEVYQQLAVASAAWLDHQMASAVDGQYLLTRNPCSWVFSRSGVEAQRLGDENRARILYEQALVMDGENTGALANLGIMERRANHYPDAERLLRRAEVETADPKTASRLAPALNPDWYRLRYQLAALYTNWAADPGAEPQNVDAAGLAARQARELALDTVRAIDGRARRAPAQFVEDTLEPFLEGTIEPSALVLVACALVDPLPPAPRQWPRERPDRKSVRGVLESEPVDPWPLIAFVEKGPNRAPAVLFDLGCFYTRVGDLTRAAKRIIAAVRDTPRSERRPLIDVVIEDPTLAPLRAVRPGLIPKLRILSGLLDHNDKEPAAQFDLQDQVFAWLAADEWSVVWAQPIERFDLIAQRGQENRLIQLVTAEELTRDEVDMAIGDLKVFSTQNPEKRNVRAALMLNQDASQPPAEVLERAVRENVDVYQAVPGGFRRLPDPRANG